MSGLLLRLAGPMQSWGDHSTFSERDTQQYPTRSGMIGLIASALGRRRGAAIDDLAALTFTTRVDRPGQVMEDFHTVGGGLPREQTVITAEGKRREEGKTTIVSRRYYLADAVFTVAVNGPEDVLAMVAQALQNPVWAPYLGRRSCPAEAPLLLRWPVADPVAELHEAVPLARKVPDEDGTVDVDFFLEESPSAESVDTSTARLTFHDVPLDLHPHRRRYGSRAGWVVSRKLPARLCHGYGNRYLAALREYLEGAETK